jgi:hypothetical protein
MHLTSPYYHTLNPAGCHGGLTALQHCLLLCFGPALIARMDPEQCDALPSGVQEALFHLHEDCFRNIQGIKVSHMTVIWDSGASVSILFDHSNFVSSPLKPILAHVKL